MKSLLEGFNHKFEPTRENSSTGDGSSKEINQSEENRKEDQRKIHRASETWETTLSLPTYL